MVETMVLLSLNSQGKMRVGEVEWMEKVAQLESVRFWFHILASDPTISVSLLYDIILEVRI